MKWIIVLLVLVYLYLTMAIQIETIDPTINSLAGLPVNIKIKDILSLTGSGNQNSLIQIKFKI